MRRTVWILCVMLTTLPSLAQDEQSGGKDEFQFVGMYDGTGNSQMTTPVGVAFIGDQKYISMRLQPELSFGKFGIGFDIPLMFNTDDGSLRTDEFKDGVGPLRIVRYARYGVKHQDPVYARVGDITGTSLGYGLIMFNYTNAVSFDKRQVGLNVDLNYQKRFGFEAVYSDFSDFKIFGVRPYVRPLQTSGIPILKTLEFGASYITDHDKASYYDVSEMGVDVGVTVLENSFVQIVPYIEYAHIFENSTLKDDIEQGALKVPDENGDPLTGFPTDLKYGGGNGLAIGTNFKFRLIADVFYLGTKIERRIYGDNFIGQFFDPTYEAGKLSVPTVENGRIVGGPRVLALAQAEGVQGTYGEIYGNLINKVQILGAINIPDKLKKTDGATIHIGLSAPELIPKVVITGTYDKGRLDDLADAFKLDDRSIAHLQFGYKIYPYLLSGVDYKYTFVEKESGGFKAKAYVTPFVALQFNLPVGDQKK